MITRSKSHLLVVGDVMLDLYTCGVAERVSPEAPVLVLKAEREESRLGGAGAVATLLAALGARPIMASLVGNDPAGQVVSEHHLERIDVLKLDCEGSEFSILENTASLDRIGAIVGEYHGRERFLELVARRFADWRLRILRDGDPGTFWLSRDTSVENILSRHAAIPPAADDTVLPLPSGKGWGEGDVLPRRIPPAGGKDDAVERHSADTNGLSVDLTRGMAFQVDRSRPRDYDDAYFQKYLDYEGSALSSRLGRLRTSLVKKHCRTVLDIGIGCGTFLKQWAVAACGCGCRESSAKIGKPKKPCPGCKQGRLPAIGAAQQAQVHGYGYDVNPRAVDWLKERALFVNPYASIPPEIDGLTFWDSLEHLPEPADLLARMRVGMFAFVSLPIFSDLSRLAESKHYRPGEHFYYFTSDGLRRFMAEQGFDCLTANRDESRAGRDSIETFVFRKTRGPRLPADWHRRAMGEPLREIEPGRPLTLRTANGIGDLCWLMTLAGPLKRRLSIPKLTLELQLAGDRRDNRALEFARRFSEVDEVTSTRFDIHLRPVAADARLRYIPNGYLPTRSASEANLSTRSASEADPSTRTASEANLTTRGARERPYTLILNPWLEWQGRLEHFLPEIEPQWDVLTAGYRRDPAEIAAAANYSRPGRLLGRPRTGHLCIHLCSRADNTTSGMNRGGLWSLDHWVALLERLRTITDLPIYILGAQEDADYAGELMQRARRVAGLYDACGATSTTLAIEILRQSSLMVSFASGLAVAACYLGVPTVAFWRAAGESISASDDYWYGESFATNWVPPGMLASGRYHPAIYGRDTPDSVFAALQRMLCDAPPAADPKTFESL